MIVEIFIIGLVGILVLFLIYRWFKRQIPNYTKTFIKENWFKLAIIPVGISSRLVAMSP